MKIVQAQVGNTIVALNAEEPLPVSEGDILRVSYTFDYKVAESVDVEVWASLYGYTLGILDRADSTVTKETITLDKSIDWSTYAGEIYITIPQVSGAIGGLITPGIDAGLWGILCELPQFGIEGYVGGSILAIAPPSVLSMIPMLIMVMVMSMIMNMMGESELFKKEEKAWPKQGTSQQ